MAIPRITLEQWQALVSVVDSGSYAKAAEALHKTQSTVTYGVQKIESLLGVKLFEVRGRKAVLTATGQTLYRRARMLLGEAAGLESAAQRLSAGWEAELRVVMDQLFPTAVMLLALERFGSESPHTHIELVESVISGTQEALLNRQTDLAIGPEIPAGFLGEPLLRMRLIAVAHPDHPLHKLGRDLTYDDLRAHRQLVVRESGSERRTRLLVEATQRWTVSHMATSIHAVRLGYGYAWLAEEKIREELAARTLEPLRLREGPERYAQLYLLFGNRELAGPGTLRLAALIREAVSELCPAPSAGTAPVRTPASPSADASAK
jgi:DNA-binding transcriptional LysR family regulator